MPVRLLVTALFAVLAAPVFSGGGQTFYRLKGSFPGNARFRLWAGETVKLLPHALLKTAGIVHFKMKKVSGSGFLLRLVPDSIAKRRFVLEYGIGLAAAVASGQAEKRIKRLLAEAVIRAADRKLGWSRTRRWRSFNTWRGPFSSVLFWKSGPENRSSTGFADPAGRESPARDLATFAARFLVPDDLFGKRAAGKPSLKNILVSQSRFLRERLAVLQPGFVAAMDRLVPDDPRLAKWTDPANISRVELVLAAPSSVSMASLFGHLFLRIVPRSRTGIKAFYDTPVYGYIADFNGPIERDSFYVLKGIFGYYRAVLRGSSFREFHRQYVLMENRDLRRWRINLEGKMLRRFMERLWTEQRTVEYGYFFFSANCASFLVDLFNGLLPGKKKIHYAGSLFSAPTATLDAYASFRMANGKPFLTYLPETYPGIVNGAILASRRRRLLGEKMAGVFSGSRVKKLFRQSMSRDKDRRASAYRSLTDLFFRAEDPRLRARFYSWLRHSLVVENHFSTQSNLKEEMLRNKKRLAGVRRIVKGLIATLPEGFRRLYRPEMLSKLSPVKMPERKTLLGYLAGALKLVGDREESDRVKGYIRLNRIVQGLVALRRSVSNTQFGLHRQAAWLVSACRLLARCQSHLNFDYSLRRVPGLYESLLKPVTNRGLNGQPYHLAAESPCQYVYVTRLTPNVLLLNDLKGQFLRKTGYRADPYGWSMQLRKREEKRNRKLYDRSYPFVGINPFRLGSVYYPGTKRPALTLRSALIRETLGDMRRHGFVSTSALSVMDGELTVGWREERPEVLEYRGRAIGFRSLRPLLREDSGWTRNIGWMLNLDFRTSVRDNIRFGLELQYALTFPLAADETCRNHLLLNTGIVAGALYPDEANSRMFSASGLVQLEWRFELPFFRNFMNFHRTVVEFRPVFDVEQKTWHREYSVRSELSLVLSTTATPFWSRRTRGVRLFAGGEYLWKTHRYHNRGPGEFRLQLGIELN